MCVCVVVCVFSLRVSLFAIRLAVSCARRRLIVSRLIGSSTGKSLIFCDGQQSGRSARTQTTGGGLFSSVSHTQISRDVRKSNSWHLNWAHAHLRRFSIAANKPTHSQMARAVAVASLRFSYEEEKEEEMPHKLCIFWRRSRFGRAIAAAAVAVLLFGARRCASLL